LELVRYIHLNPIRARLVEDVSDLGRFPYSGHTVLLGKRKNTWQDTQLVLGMFGEKLRDERAAGQSYNLLSREK